MKTFEALEIPADARSSSKRVGGQRPFRCRTGRPGRERSYASRFAGSSRGTLKKGKPMATKWRRNWIAAAKTKVRDQEEAGHASHAEAKRAFAHLRIRTGDRLN